MHKVTLNTKNSISTILIDNQIKGCLLDYINKDIDKILIITDSNLACIYADYFTQLQESFAQKNITSHLYTIRAGERSKTLETHKAICLKLAELSFTRSDCVLSVGGGVVTDIGGFVASTFMRGIAWISMPTTLLGMVDASIGGKCGVNLESGKNLVGSFYQPDYIFIDPDFLSTLSEKEFNCGIAEVIKYGVIADKSLFKLLDNVKENIKEIIIKSVEIKVKVVESDEKESLARMVLNFGHTFGHIIEKIGNYTLFSHGESVAYGMRLEAEMLKKLGLVNDNKVIDELTAKFNLNINPALSKVDLIRNVFGDKKMRGDYLYFAGYSEIGKAKIYKFTKDDILSGINQLFSD